MLFRSQLTTEEEIFVEVISSLTTCVGVVPQIIQNLAQLFFHLWLMKKSGRFDRSFYA